MIRENFRIIEFSFIPPYVFKNDILERSACVLFDFLKKTVFVNEKSVCKGLRTIVNHSISSGEVI